MKWKSVITKTTRRFSWRITIINTNENDANMKYLSMAMNIFRPFFHPLKGQWNDKFTNYLFVNLVEKQKMGSQFFFGSVNRRGTFTFTDIHLFSAAEFIVFAYAIRKICRALNLKGWTGIAADIEFIQQQDYYCHDARDHERFAIDVAYTYKWKKIV